MALTKLRGNTQIKSATITNVEIAVNAGIELAKLAEGAELIKRDGSVAFTGNVNLGSNRLVNVAAPTSASDAANMGYVDDEVAIVQAEVDAEELARAAADTQLQANIDAEALARAAADTTLQGNVDAEALARAAADTTLQGNIDDEAANRLAGDQQLQSNLDDEADTRADADTVLSNRATALEGRATSLEGRMDTAEDDIDALEVRASTLENGLQSETSARIAADSAIQSELDASQVGAGLGADGAYSAIASSNYLKATDFSAASLSGSLHNADKLLDAAVKAEVDARIADVNAEESRALAAEGVLQDNIDAEEAARIADVNAEESRAMSAESDLQAELDDTQVGAGLQTDGSYVAHAGSNYLKSADFVAASLDASLHNADKLMDIALKAEVDARIADVNAEESRALAAEGVLQGNIDAEESRAIAAEGVLQGNIDAEESARIAADNVLQGNIDAEESARIAADAATLASANSYTDAEIAALVNSAPAVLDTLKELSDALGGDENFAITLSNQLGEINADIAAEEAARIAEDLTFLKLDGSRAMQGELKMVNNFVRLGAVRDNTPNTKGAQLHGQYGLYMFSVNGDGVEDIYTSIDSNGMYVETSITGRPQNNQGSILIDPVNGPEWYINSYADAGVPVNDTHLTTKKYVDEEIASAVSTGNADVAAEQARAEAAEAALQAELDATQVGAGLTVDGDYLAHVGANYIKSADFSAASLSGSLHNADKLLDVALKAEVDARIADVDAEQSRAEAVEAILDGRLDALEPRMDTAEADIDALEGRATALEGRATAVEGRATAAEGRLSDLESQTVYIVDVVTRETPSGAVDGSNDEFELAHDVVFGSEQVFLNGLLQEPGVGNDYTISGSVITFNNAPITNDRVRVTYLKVKGS